MIQNPAIRRIARRLGDDGGLTVHTTGDYGIIAHRRGDPVLTISRINATRGWAAYAVSDGEQLACGVDGDEVVERVEEWLEWAGDGP